MDAETFVTRPIIFGDFMKMGASEQDRMYEELTDMNKVKNILQDVSEREIVLILMPQLHVFTWIKILEVSLGWVYVII